VTSTREQLSLRRLASEDSGLSLMEVIIAIAIMTTIALAAASLSLNGTKTESAEERQQVAVTIANGYMEQVSGWTTDLDTTTGVSMLYDGRTQAAVTAAFHDNASPPGVAQTNAVWDSHAPGDQANPSLQITPPSFSQNGTTYSVTTLIGSCYQSTTIQSGGTTTSPVLNNCVATQTANSDAMIRVIVIVKWMAGAKCQVNGCFYDTSTLLDPNADLEWVTH
jgi:prepilin-type N-terminal cleavage/methylation domain-containing protein